MILDKILLLPLAAVPLAIFGTLLWQSIKNPELFVPISPFASITGLGILMEEQRIAYSIYLHNRNCIKGIGSQLN